MCSVNVYTVKVNTCRQCVGLLVVKQEVRREYSMVYCHSGGNERSVHTMSKLIRRFQTHLTPACIVMFLAINDLLISGCSAYIM